MSGELGKVFFLQQGSFRRSNFMQRLHPDRKQKKDINLPIYCDINRELVPWMSYHDAVVSQTTETNPDNGDGTIRYIYTPDHNMNYLFYVSLRATLPAIRIRKGGHGKIRIAWPENIFHHIINNGGTSFGTDPGPSIPSGWMDIQAGYFMKPGPGQEENYYDSIGNRKHLTKWTDHLPIDKIACHQPWYFSESVQRAVPLYTCDLSTMRIYYMFRLQVLALLKMEFLKKYEDGTTAWLPVVDIDDKATMLESVTKDDRISVPTMVARYGKMDKDEYEFKLDKSQSVLATSIIKKTTPNSIPAGSSTKMELDTSTPVLAAYFNAQHEEAKNMNNFSNYTTDPWDMWHKSDPIDRVTHFYSGKESKSQDKMSFKHIMPWYHSLSSPRPSGYGMCSWGNHPHLNRPDVGVVFDKTLAGHLQIKLRPDFEAEDKDGVDVQDDFDTTFKSISQSATTAENISRNKYHINLFLLTRYIIHYKRGSKVRILDGTEDTLHAIET